MIDSVSSNIFKPNLKCTYLDKTGLTGLYARFLMEWASS